MVPIGDTFLERPEVTQSGGSRRNNDTENQRFMHGGAAFGTHLLIYDLIELSVPLLPDRLVMLGPGPSISRRIQIGSNWASYVWAKTLGLGPRMTIPGESYCNALQVYPYASGTCPDL